MTLRRYYNDSYTHVFDATVIETSSNVSAPYAILDESFFYPNSGGQPHDVGTLGDANVIDVNIRESDGAVIHRLDAPIATGIARASINGTRRFDHMQQHTGQHILSQAFIRTANAATIGFHLGIETVSIDLDAPALATAAIAEAAELANAIVSGNVEVRAWFPTAAEIEALALRKMPDVDGPLRVVAIGDFDYSACGGTHVSRSSEVGLLSVLRIERMKRGTRIEFLCGHRARADYARKHAIVQELSAALTCAPALLPEAVERQAATITETRRALAAYRERDLDDEAARLAATATPGDGMRIVRAAYAGRAIDDVKGLALRVTSEPDVIALLGVIGERTQIIFARSENVTANFKPVFDQALADLGGGKGGGGRILMGSAPAVSASTLEEVLQKIVVV